MKYILLFLVLACTLCKLQAQTSKSYFSVGQKPYQLLYSTQIKKVPAGKPVLIAVIDDAFNLSHRQLEPYYYTNPGEIKNNLKDDDQNGFTDDAQGWDLADHDNKVTPPAKDAPKENFSHGSMIAGIITRTAELTLGKAEARKHVRILPIKVIKDKATIGNYENGYEGIQYALTMGAHIICLPWSGGKFDEKYLPLFEQAQAKGVLILASAGNFYSEDIQYPGSLPGVQPITALDTNFVKLPSSNYSTNVALSAVGQNVLAPYAYSDSLYTYCEKTSAAVALITGCATVLKAIRPALTATEIMLILQNTSTPIDHINPEYIGKLGSGAADMSKAVSSLLHDQKLSPYFDSKRSKGALMISRKEGQKQWELHSSSKSNELTFKLLGDSRKLTSQYIHFMDSQGKLIRKTSLSDFPEMIRFKGEHIKIFLEGSLPRETIHLQYQTFTIDSSRLYCDQTIEFNSDAGVFDDGSQEQYYASNSSCKWQISVKQGKNVRLDFLEFAVEDTHDNVIIFKGNKPLQENMMARFTGKQLPPSLVIDGNQVLVWFVTNKNIQDKGWKISYHSVEDKPGVVEPAR